MKKSIQSLFIAASFAAIASANPTVSDILVHQLWPWSQNIKVEYTLTGSGSEEAWNLDVKCYEGNTQIDAAKVNAALCGGEGFHSIVGNGIHTFTLDPSKLLAEGATAISDFTVSVDIAGPGDSLGVRIEYRVFDLETGKVTDLRRRDFIDHPEIYGTVITNYADLHAGFAKPADLPDEDVFIVPGFNTDNVWKTTKLVMKRIPAKKLIQDGTWYMGPVAGDTNTMAEGTWDKGATPPRFGESRFPVRLSGDFFIGIFELTQKQYAMLMNGARPSLYTNETYWATRPLENVSWEEFYNNFLPAARTALNKNVAMPSEAQWEFAARAMYDGDGSYFPSGIATDTAGWLAMEGMNGNNSNNSTDRNAGVKFGGGSGTVTVGGGLPNPFGLYNLFGNVREFTVDLGNTNLRVYYNDPTEQNPAVDPVCVSASTLSLQAPRVVKGAAYRAKGGQANVLRCATRYAISKSSKYHEDNSARTFGFRLMCPAD